MNMKHRLMIACLCSLPVGFSILSARLIGATTFQSQQSTNQSEDVRTLAPGATVELEISGGQSHIWLIFLSSGDYLRLSVDRKRINIVVELVAPGHSRQSQDKTFLSTADISCLTSNQVSCAL